MGFYHYLKLMRPAQWYKNALVFLAIIFAEVDPYPAIPKVLNFSFYPPLILGFLAFCAVSSATYILNDIQDLEADAAHPEKRNRPLPSGKATRRSAVILAVVLLVSGFVLALSLNPLFFVSIILYIITTQLYNGYLRKWAVVDVVTIAVGFIIRAISGAFLIGEPFTSWLVIGVFFFALILGFGKRKNELQYLGEDAAKHKPVFTEYTENILDQAITMSATWFVFFYTLYCFEKYSTVMDQQPIMLTVPIVAGIVLRYVYLIQSGSPVARKPHLAFKDYGILIGGILFLITLLWTLFFWQPVLDAFWSIVNYLTSLFP
ncbi:MAG: UbiA prenyltransferase family protein [Candidatus Thorarchaeota archaeon]